MCEPLTQETHRRSARVVEGWSWLCRGGSCSLGGLVGWGVCLARSTLSGWCGCSPRQGAINLCRRRLPRHEDRGMGGSLLFLPLLCVGDGHVSACVCCFDLSLPSSPPMDPPQRTSRRGRVSCSFRAASDPLNEALSAPSRDCFVGSPYFTRSSVLSSQTLSLVPL